MKFYKVEKTEDHGSSAGAEWFTVKAEADKCLRQWKTEKPTDPEIAKTFDMSSLNGSIETVEIEPTKAGILLALRRYASHPDNG